MNKLRIGNDVSEVDRRLSENLITNHAKKLIANGNSAEQVEEISMRLNEDLNNPPLKSDVVSRIVRSVISKARRQQAIGDLGYDINLKEGVISYSVSTPTRPFLFGNDVIPLGTLSVIGGLGGSGKSMAMVEMIGAAAIGGPYANRK
jgi:hypothetical protein